MNQRSENWVQWDKQEAIRIKKDVENRAWVALNNLYLAVERGDVKLSVTVCNRLLTLVGKAYPYNNHDLFEAKIREWWHEELMKLPGWFNF